MKAAAIMLVVGMTAMPQRPVIKAKEFQVINDKGNIVARVGATSTGSLFQMTDINGKPSIVIDTAPGSTTLSMYQDDDISIAIISDKQSKSIQLMDGKVIRAMIVLKGKDCAIGLVDSKEKPTWVETSD